MDFAYHRRGDHLFPDLTISEAQANYGKYGMLRRTYLKEHKRGWYQSLLLSGKLDAHLEETDRTANERVDLIASQIAVREGITEALKAEAPLLLAARMNSVFLRAEEIVLSELVYR